MQKITTLIGLSFLELLLGFTPFNADVNSFQDGYVTVSAFQLDFNLVETGTIGSQTLTIFNGGSDILSVESIVLDGDSFSITGYPPTIGQLSSCDLEITFSPTQNITTSGILLIKLFNIDSDIMISLIGVGDYPGSYYDSTSDLWGENLKSELSDIIDGHTDLGYNTARDRMYDTIDNENCTVEGVYSGIVITACNRSEAQAQGFDTEHTWPKSKGAQSSPPKSDLHHLYPTYSQFNSTRGNLPFGNVVNSNWPNGVPNNSDSDRGYNSSGVEVFEPRDIHKGDVARSMFYFALRYNNPYNFLDGQEAVLRQWFYEDSVSTKEIDRNEAIFGYQNNRSPFVDHPEFLERISSISGTATLPSPTALMTIFADTLFLYSWMTDYDLAIGNYGNASLQLDPVEIEPPSFTVEPTQVNVEPETVGYLNVSFSESEPGIFLGQLTLETNDANLLSISLPLKAINYQLGDANTDGSIDIQDVVLIVGFIYQLEMPDQVQDLLTDINFDGQMDVLDIVTIVDILLSN